MAERIDIVVTETGARRVRRDLEQIGRSGRQAGDAAGRLRSQFSGLRGVFATLGVGLLARQLFSLSDAFTQVRNRTRIALDGVGNLNGTLDELFGIASRTRTPIAQISELFQRASIASNELGASQQEILRFVEAVGQGLAIQGGAAASASGALLQLSQSLGSGIVRAEEFNSILEGAFPIAQAAARGLDEAGGSVARLRQLVIDGQVSSEAFFRAILSQADALQETFALTEPTIGQALTVLRNGLVRAADALGEFTGPIARQIRDVGLALQVIAGVRIENLVPPGEVERIQRLADTLEDVGRAAAAVATTIGAVLAKRAIGAAIGAVRALTAAIAANPIGALAVGVTAAVSALAFFSDEITVSSDGLVTLQDLGLATFNVLAEKIGPLATAIQERLGAAVGFVVDAFAGLGITLDDVLGAARTFVNRFIGLQFALQKSVLLIFQKLAQGIIDFVGPDFFATIGGAISAIIDFVGRQLDALISFARRGLEVLGVAVAQTSDLLASAGIDVPSISIPEGVRSTVQEIQDVFRAELSRDFIGELIGAAAPLATEIGTEARRISQERIAEEERQRAELEAQAGGGARGGGENRSFNPPDQAREEVLRSLEREIELLGLSNREREVRAELFRIEDQLKRELTLAEVALIEPQLRQIQALQQQADVLDQIRGPREELAEQQRALNALLAQGAITAGEFNAALAELRLIQLEEQVATGEGGFAEGFLLQLELMRDGVTSFGAEAGQTFGRFFGDVQTGFADAATQALLFGGDVREALGNVARQAVQQLISTLIRLAVQALITRVALSFLPGVGAAPAGRDGGLVTPGGIQGFLGGGLVSGPGGPRDDAILARLSAGEFVVNAEATRRNLETLRAMNAGRSGAERAAQPAPASEVNLRVVNVMNEQEMLDALSTPAGERAILNVVQRNPGSFRRSLR